MLYGIKTRLAVGVFLFLVYSTDQMFAQASNSTDVQNKKAVSMVQPNSGSAIKDTNPDKLDTTAPVDAIDFNNLGVGYAQKKLYDEAVPRLLRAIELDPKFRNPYLNLSAVYDFMERPDDALAMLRKAAQLAPLENFERVKECELLLFGNHNPEAANCYQNILKMGPLETVETLNYGVALIRSERWQEALEALEKDAPQMQRDARYLNALGMARYKTGHFKASAETFKQAVELVPDEKQVRFNLALAELADRNKPGALSQYKLLSESAPDLAQELFNIIYSDKLIFVHDH